MNKRIVLMACVLAGVAMASCDKETDIPMGGIPEGAVMLTTEGYTNQNGEKTSVAGTTVEWVGEGEVVRLNSYTPSVEVSGDKAFVRDVTLSGAVYGYYPSTIVDADGWETTTPTVTVPSSYACVMSGDRQVVALPMVAYSATAGDEIEFKHLTAAVNVMVWNATETDLYVDRVVVTVAGHRLHGDVSLNFDNADYGIASSFNDPTNEADSTVSVTFPSFGEGSLVISPGEGNARSIQVPILPVNNDRDITIQIYTHVSGAAWHKYIFSHHASMPNALIRNTMLTARCKIHTGDGSHVYENKFTVSNGQQVFFSPGNLQYIGKAATPYWKFADHQYDVIYDTTHQERADADINRDLFGWGTWNSPTKNSNTSTGYSWTYDWGHNPISNGGNIADLWYTLSGSAWETLLISRTTTMTGLPYSIDNTRFTMANIGGINKGMIVFPDNYIHPKGTNFTSGTYNDYSNYTAIVSLEGWTLMEEAGAIFLPATGIRKWSKNSLVIGDKFYGYYWSSTNYYETQAHALEFCSSYVNAPINKNRNLGMAVRLVTNAN